MFPIILLVQSPNPAVPPPPPAQPSLILPYSRGGTYNPALGMAAITSLVRGHGVGEGVLSSFMVVLFWEVAGEVHCKPCISVLSVWLGPNPCDSVTGVPMGERRKAGDGGGGPRDALTSLSLQPPQGTPLH